MSSLPFPAIIEVTGCPLIDGTYHLADPSTTAIKYRWGFVYTRSDAAWVLCYGEEQPELGGAGYVGWVIGRLLPSASVDVIARCIKRIGDTVCDFEWTRRQTDDTFRPDDRIAARPVATEECVEGLLPCPAQPPVPPRGFVGSLRQPGLLPQDFSTIDGSSYGGVEMLNSSCVVWKLEVLKDRLKHCPPGTGIHSEPFCLDETEEMFRFVLYPFGTVASPTGSVSLALERVSGDINTSGLQFTLRIGNAMSGQKKMHAIVNDFHVDFGRSAVTGIAPLEHGKRLEGLEAEVRHIQWLTSAY